MPVEADNPGGAHRLWITVWSCSQANIIIIIGIHLHALSGETQIWQQPFGW